THATTPGAPQAPRRRAARDGHAGQQEVGAGAQRAAPKDRPVGNLMCARPTKVNPPPRATPLRGAAGKVVNEAGEDLHLATVRGPTSPPKRLLFRHRLAVRDTPNPNPSPEATGNLVAHGADTRLDDGSAHLFHRSIFYHKSGHMSTIHDVSKLLDGMNPPTSHRPRRHPQPIGYLLLGPVLHTIPSNQHLLRPSAKLAKSPVEINALKEVVAHPRIRTPKMLTLATFVTNEAITDLR